MTRRYILPLTYAPKIPAVLHGECTQTIRAGWKFKVGDLVMFHGWEGRPYRSKWSFRTPYWEIHTVWDVIVTHYGMQFPELKVHYDFSPKQFVHWDFLNWLAVLDGIEPPNGATLGNVLLSMNKIVPTVNNLFGECEMQVIRWTFSNETSGGV